MIQLALPKELLEPFGDNHRSLDTELRLMRLWNEDLELGFDPGIFERAKHLQNLVYILHSPELDDLHSLHYRAASKHLSDAVWHAAFGEPRMPPENPNIAAYRALGLTTLADLLEEYESLVDMFEFDVVYDGTKPEFVRVLNEEALEAKRAAFHARLVQVVDNLGYKSAEQIKVLFPELDDVMLLPYAECQQHWFQLLLNTLAFETFEPEEPADEWLLAWEPCGWLTKRHGAALQAHGYTYRFSFWEQKLRIDRDEIRGNLWIQTDKGPLRLYDETDALASKSNFPVKVFSITGEPLFDLKEKDVPWRLMRQGQYPDEDFSDFDYLGPDMDRPVSRLSLLWRKS